MGKGMEWMGVDGTGHNDEHVGMVGDDITWKKWKEMKGEGMDKNNKPNPMVRQEMQMK
jgi:hypothetical protein